ncbi:hypothetical protein BASA82_000016 [Batrachochytrium salamandrivorans]|nr:hypothetical protein BASA81_000214 [Batrachochytrium salamandrivorans]KAH9262962.1 hypothetical protein BASA82_000016 [Batrachochytrium salamandrivorans]
MSFNDLVTAAVQRTSELASSPSFDLQQQQQQARKAKRPKPTLIPSPDPNASGSGGGEDEEEKQKKRRAQIAEASRRSRARRKKEFQDFKEENDQLWSQNIQLRKTLQDANVDVPAPPLISKRHTHTSQSGSEDEDGEATPCPSPFHPAPSSHLYGSTPTPGGMFSPFDHSAVLASASATAAAVLSSYPVIAPPPPPAFTASAASSPPPPAVMGDKQPEFSQFFELRLNWYFTQLKQDCLRSFASQLSYEEKQRLAGLQVRLVENAESSSTPVSTGATTTVAPPPLSRLIAANQAEQAVNLDKTLRL